MTGVQTCALPIFFDAFRTGEIGMLVVSKVANFSIDLPSAEVAIQVSGSFGSRQEEAQRLGRLLRPGRDGKVAHFYTVVARDTVDADFAAHRQRFLAEQGYAYRIFVEQSLRAGEGVFYFMPGIRYVSFLFHVLFGNNDVVIAIVTQSLLIGSGLLICSSLFKMLLKVDMFYLVALVIAAVVVTITTIPLVTQLAIASASEIYAWFAFNVAVTLILMSIQQSVSTRSAIFLGSLFGLVVFLRPNYVMVSVTMVIATCTLICEQSTQSTRVQKFINCSWLIVSFGAISGLALAHNLYYGETFSFFTNRADPSQTIFQPAEIFQFFSNSVVRIATFDKFQKFFYWQVPSLDAFLLASWASQAVFLYALFRSLRVRRLTSSHLFLSTPVAYVISSIPFGIMNIPEQIGRAHV